MRWLAYTGTPVLIDELLYRPTHSLIDQSLHRALGADTTNGDGFGDGWYAADKPGHLPQHQPAWNDQNLRELAGHIESPLLSLTSEPLAAPRCRRRTAIRSATATGVDAQRRDPPVPRGQAGPTLAVDPELYRHRRFDRLGGDVLPRPDLGLGPTRLRRWPGGRARRGGGASTGSTTRSRGRSRPPTRRVWAFRYSQRVPTRGRCSTAPRADAPRALSRQRGLPERRRGGSRASSSPSCSAISPGVWNAVPESSYGVIQPGPDELLPFTPRPPSSRSTV